MEKSKQPKPEPTFDIKPWECKEPEDMTPAEREERIVELLAIASVRLARKERELATEAKLSDDHKSSKKTREAK